MLYFVLGFLVLGAVCLLGAKSQQEQVRYLEADPNLQARAARAQMTIKCLHIYAAGCGLSAVLIFLNWLF